ncbi:MAG: hypothetical protein EB113_00280 [Actinobacteria bacterium]|nr:hypothetical protein [Actinomycetota bacterium]
MSKAFLALLLVFSTLIPTAHAVDIPATFSFQGSGYGHGVGLSQMGARYMANAGQSAEQIIKYFYKDVEIEPKDDSKILRVNIGNLISSAKISSTSKGSQLQIIQGDVGSESVIPVFSLADSISFSVIGSTSFWPIAALEAQAIASRTYALSKAGVYKSACDCDLYGSISDQTFLGYAKEIEKKFGVVWKDVVTRTAGLTITQSGLPITAYFSSSSGGKTELALNAWGSAKAYTQIVDDPGSLDLSINPRFVAWNREVPQSVIAAAFDLPDVVSLEILGINESGTVAQIQAISSTGVKVALRGELFRSRTKIPSAWFSLVSMQN